MLLLDKQTGTRFKAATVAPLCASVPICKSEIRQAINHCPLWADGKGPFGKAQVRKPACGWLHVFSVLANWDTVRSALIEISLVYNAGRLSVCFVDYRTAVPFVGTAVFFIGFECPRDKGKRGAERR